MPGGKKPPNQIFFRKPCDANYIAEKMSKMKMSGTSPVTNPNPPPIGDGPWLRFEDMNLNEDLLRGIFAYGHEKPATIQQQAIVPVVHGKDLIMQAQSGTGKTAALCIGILQRLNLNDKQNCQALVLAPTRELALQITEVFRALSQFMGIKLMSATGGTKLQLDKEKLSGGGISIVIGTLGRVFHLAEDGFLLMDTVRIFALDEADKMLTDLPIRTDLGKLISTYIEGDAQIILMSATMPKLTLDRANEIQRNPESILVNNYELTLDGIKQYHINVDDEERKIEALFDLRAIIEEEHTVVFCNTRKKVFWLAKKLAEKGESIFSSICADNDQGQRNQALKEFRSGKTKLIITSDLLGRGIDIHQVSLIVNFDLPKMTEEYIHRVGRGGRYGRKGIALTFITKDEVDHLREITQFYNTEIPPMPRNIFK